jgi:nitrous oxidase accessory protein
MNISRIIFFLLPIFLSGNSKGEKIRVGANETVTSLKHAIERASPNDTLLVARGVYREGNIILQKSLVILAEEGAVLDGENKYEIFTVHAKNLVLQGLTFINTGIASIEDIAAVKLLQSENVRIEGNKFRNTFFGIYLANSHHVQIINNDMESDATSEHQIGNGIHLWKCQNITIEGNRVKGHRDGIYFEFVTNSLISHNHSEGNLRYGLHFMFSHDDEYRNNTFLNNGVGVAVMYTKGVKMFNNRFIHNWGSSSYGLLLKDIRDSEVSDNQFSENSVGIFMEGSSRNTLQRNEFIRNGYAIKLQASCDDNRIVQNNFQQNTFDLVTNGSLVLNLIEENYWDRYDGYDLNRDNVGDVPYRPISVYGMIVERMPTAVLLWRSFLVFLLDRAERAIPVITPENLKDNLPAMKPYDFN